MPRQGKSNNIRLVAARAGVSVASVSRVVNNRTDVSEETRLRVQAVIDELNFSPNKGKERIFNIGVILSSDQPIISNYISPLIAGMTDYACRNGVIISAIMNSLGNGCGRSLLQLVRERRCDAICLPMSTSCYSAIGEIERAGNPTMAINGPFRGRRLGFINNNAYLAACQVTGHLINLGHRKIGYLSQFMENDENHQHRFKGYCETLVKAGIQPEKRFFVEHIPTQLAQEAGYLQALKLFEQAPDVTAIVAADDEMAMGAYKACWKTRRRIPDDISVVGFDDLPQSEFLTPGLTTARQPLFEVGTKAINYLVLHLQGNLNELPCETLDPELVVRDSTAPAKSPKANS